MTVDNEPRGVPPGVPANLITPQGNVPAIGVPNTQDYARLVFSAPYFETIAIAEVIQPSVTEAVENALPSLIPPYVDNAVLAGIQQYAVLLTGSTMSGPLFLSPLMPTADSQAATKAYVDAMLATAGIPEVPPVPQGQIWARETGQWVPISQSEGTFLPLTGGTMGGSINMSGNTITNMAAVPAMPNGAAPAQWVLNQIASVSLYQGTWDADTNTPDLTQLSTHVNAYTWIAITTSVSGVVIGAAIPGLQGMTIFNGDTIIYSTAQGAFSAIHAGGITLPEADARYVMLAGSQMSGALLLNSDATQNMQAVTFQQLEAAVANTVTPDAPADGQAYLRVGVGTNRWVPGLPLAGGILTGSLTLAGNATTALMPVPLQQMTSAITAAAAGLLPIAGGTMTGPIVLASNATTNLNPVPLQQLNSMLATYATQAFVTAGFLPLTGGTLTGTLNIGSSGVTLATNGQVNANAIAAGAIASAGNLLVAQAMAIGGATLAAPLALSLPGESYLWGPGGGGWGLSTANNTYTFYCQNTSDPAMGLSQSGTLLMQVFSTGNMTIHGTLSQGSDATGKTNINPITQGISLVRQLLPKSFQRIIPDGAPANAQNPVQWGFIAQDVQPVIPQAVGETPAIEDNASTLTLDITGILAAVTNAVKQLDQRCSALEADVGIDPPAEAVA